MSNQKEERNEVILDFKSALIKIETDTGIKKGIGSVSDEMGVTRMCISNWSKKASTSISDVHYWLKGNNLQWTDLVKEQENEK